MAERVVCPAMGALLAKTSPGDAGAFCSGSRTGERNLFPNLHPGKCPSSLDGNNTDWCRLGGGVGGVQLCRLGSLGLARFLVRFLLTLGHDVFLWRLDVTGLPRTGLGKNLVPTSHWLYNRSPCIRAELRKCQLFRCVFPRTSAEMFLRESASCGSSLEQFFLKQRGDQWVALRVVPGGAHCKPDISIDILINKERTVFRSNHLQPPVISVRRMVDGSAAASATLPCINHAA